MSDFSFIHITDTHFVRGDVAAEATWASTSGAVADAAAAAIPRVAFVAHTGDVCGGATPDSIAREVDYLVAAERLGALGAPLYCAAGNHDDPALLERVVAMGPRESLRDGPRLAYFFRVGGCLGVVLDSRRGSDARGRLTAGQLAGVDRLLGDSEAPMLLFVHHPPVPLGCRWADGTLGLDNGPELHALLARRAGRVIGVFFGHVHAPIHVVRDGVSYFGGASVAPAFDVRPGADFARLERETGGFSVVAVGSDGVRVFPRRAVASPIRDR